MQLTFKKNSVLLWSVIVFILAFSIRIYYIAQKSGFHIDEALTSTITTCKYGTTLHYMPEDGRIYSGRELKELMLPKHKNFKETLSDLELLRKNDCGDYAHPNLYYIIFKIFSFPAKQLDLQSLINYGCALNLIIFSFSFVFMYKLLMELFKDNPSVIPLGLAVAFLNTGSISLTLLVRMYELQAFGVIAASYIFVILFKGIGQEKNFLTFKNLGILVLASLVCILSGYFIAVYSAFLCLILLIKLIKDRQYKGILIFLATTSLIALLTFFIYPEYFNGLGHLRAHQIVNIFTVNEYYARFNISILSSISNLRFFLFYFPIILIILYCLFFIKREKIKEIPVYLIFIAFVWAEVVMFLAPEKMLRYIAPVFPILSLIIPYFADYLKGVKKYVLMSLIVLIYIFYSFNTKNIELYSIVMDPNGYKYYDPNYDVFSSHIENLYKVNPQFVKHPDIPVVFLCSGFWDYVNIIYFFNDKQQYEFHFISFDRDEVKKDLKKSLMKDLTKYKRYFLVTGYNIDEGSWCKGSAEMANTTFVIGRIPKLSSAIKKVEEFELTKVYLIDFDAKK